MKEGPSPVRRSVPASHGVRSRSAGGAASDSPLTVIIAFTANLLVAAAKSVAALGHGLGVHDGGGRALLGGHG